MRRHITTFLIALAVAVGVSTASQTSMWQWSKTASNNANADPSINWSEGMSPSSVNDSARAMMAVLASYRDDISGVLVTAGSSTAYTLTTNSGLASTPQNGQMIAFSPHATNGISVTLQTDGGGTFPIQSSPGVGIGAGTLVLGSPYRAKFSTANSAWILEAFYGNPFAIPLGGVIPYTGSTAPNSNFVLAFGQCVSRTTYAAYFAQVGTAFGACDGTTTFGVPDLRGRAAFGLDNMGGSAANRMTSSATGCGVAFTALGAACGNESHTLTVAEIPSHTHEASVSNAGAHTHTVVGAITQGGQDGGSSRASVVTNTTSSAGDHTHVVTNSSVGGGSAHSIVNPAIALNYIVRIN